MRLNESYHPARSQILIMDLLPIINHAYVIVVGDEGQKVIVTNISLMRLNYVGLDSIVMYSKVDSSS